MSKINSQELLRLYRTGNNDAATAIFERYVNRLIGLVRTRLGPKLKRRIDAEDVVQSAYRSFFIHAKDDQYQLAKAGDLWSLLASITLHKLHRQAEKQTAAKRSVQREAPDESADSNFCALEPSAAEVVGVAEELQLVIDQLAPIERQVLTSMLQGRSLEETSIVIGKSPRTARRLLAEVQRKIERRLMNHENVAQTRQCPVTEPHVTLRYADYVIEQLIGSGGMGKVFRAIEKSTGKKVAIKALHKSRQSDERAIAQFVQEAGILAQFQHPNIVGVKGLGRFPSGGYFSVMDFVDGTDLERRIESDPMPLCEIVRIVKDVAAAVQYAHDQGVVHCDLKPGNVLISTKGHVRVTDFGFAFLVTRASEASKNLIGGTTGYIAPEILQRESQPTPAADIYALGMLMKTLMTRNSPESAESLCQGNADGAIASAISYRCLSREPSKRYQSASDVIEALEGLNSHLVD